jgi:hypothetical protein
MTIVDNTNRINYLVIQRDFKGGVNQGGGLKA